MSSTAVFHWLFLLLLVLLPSSTPLPFQIHSDDIKFLQDDQEQQSPARNELDWQWQRTGFHFQPSRNWMNDPNGPLYYKGLYHLFYQYNPFAAVWGNITWGHAISKDLVRWHYVKDLALIPDRWYDIKGVWSGAATIVHAKPILLYTGWSNSSSQIQNMAVPKNASDPLLREWVKDDRVNPIAVAPPGINSSDFRDPTTAWIGHDGHWRMAVGSKNRSSNTGIILQYRSKDFARWELLDKLLHTGPGTGMWECPDFFPVLALGKNGAENYLQGGRGGGDNSATMKFVVKVSLDEKRWDTYVVGDYDPVLEEFKPSLSSNDIGNGDLRYDYGIYYASKTFFDPVKKRRILLGWISEADKPASDIRKGWASLQATPRHIWLDESKHALRQWPISEITSLRKHPVIYGELLLKKGMVKELKAAQGSQLDIEVVFEIPTAHLHNKSSTAEYDFENDYNFETSGVEGIPNNTLMYCNGTFPSAQQIIGPFGLHVLASSDLRERTAVFFKFLRFKDGWKTLVCNDLTSSSLASDSTKGVYGSTVSITRSEKKSLSLRILVDHSIVETFAQGGKTCITARSYPLLEGDDNIAHLFLFNNGSIPVKVTKLAVWKMDKIHYTTI